MEKETFKAGNMLYPLPVVMVSCKEDNEKANIITVAWAGTVCTNPPMLSVSIRPERYSYGIIERTGEFVVNLTNEALVKAADYCGVKSGRDTDKFSDMCLTEVKADYVKVPLILESPINIECRVKEIIKLGSHNMFLAEVIAVHVDKQLISNTGKFELNTTKPIVYSHGEYYSLGSILGSFGYSIKKNVRNKNKNNEKYLDHKDNISDKKRENRKRKVRK